MTFDREQRKIYHARLMYARPFIDSLDFAGNGRQISGEMPIAEMPRLLDALENSEGILEYAVRGGIDKQGNSLLEVSISGNCRLRCQRCLGAMEHPVRIDTKLLLRDQASIDVLNGGSADEKEDEGLDSILADTHLDVLDLLEEEVLLSLPISPRHEFGACQATGVGNGHVGGSPFAVLAKLKRSA